MPTAQNQVYYTNLLAQFIVAILRPNRANTPFISLPMSLWKHNFAKIHPI